MSIDRLYALSPTYGTGIMRRRIRVTGRPREVLVEMEDIAHGMRLRVEHDGKCVTDVHPEFVRYPMTTCTGAEGPLRDVVGTPLGADFATFFAGGRARSNCTHMIDLAWLAVRHGMRGETVRLYDFEMPDMVEDRTSATAWRDGEKVVEWQLDKFVITAPDECAGINVFNGFTRWALDALDPETLEAALMLQKVCLVGHSRKFKVVEGPMRPEEAELLGGICYGFDPARAKDAFRFYNTRRDFTDRPEDLLKFIPDGERRES